MAQKQPWAFLCVGLPCYQIHAPGDTHHVRLKSSLLESLSKVLSEFSFVGL